MSREYIKGILKDFYRSRPAEGEPLDAFLDLYTGLIMDVMVPEAKVEED